MIYENEIMTGDVKGGSPCCVVFGVEHGGPVIGLGILLILFGIFPFLLPEHSAFPILVTILFIVFGGFLIWLGIAR